MSGNDEMIDRMWGFIIDRIAAPTDDTAAAFYQQFGLIPDIISMNNESVSSSRKGNFIARKDPGGLILQVEIPGAGVRRFQVNFSMTEIKLERAVNDTA